MRMLGLTVLVGGVALGGCFPETNLDVEDDTRPGGGSDGGDGGGSDDGGTDDGGSDDGGTDDGGTDEGGTDSGEVASVKLSSVEPAHGSTAGGLEVTITGGGFDQGSRVWFGDVEADQILSMSDTELVVEVPATRDHGTVSVKVVNADDQGSPSSELDEAFTYWEDATGLAVGIAEVSRWDFGDGTGELIAYASLIEPTDVSLMALTAEDIGDCVSSATWKRTLDAGDSVHITGAQDLQLDYDADSDWYSGSDDADSSVGTSARFGLRTDAGAYPALEVTGMATLPSSPDLDSGEVDFDSNGADDELGISFQWAGSGGDYVVVGASGTGSDGVTERVMCVVADDQAHALNGDEVFKFMPYFAAGDWDSYTITVWVARYAETVTPLEFSNGELRAQGAHISVQGWVLSYASGLAPGRVLVKTPLR